MLRIMSADDEPLRESIPVCEKTNNPTLSQKARVHYQSLNLLQIMKTMSFGYQQIAKDRRKSPVSASGG